MKQFTRVFQQTFWQILGKIVTAISTFIILGAVARRYGEEGTGVFTLALTYVSVFMLFVDFGFNAHILKVLEGTDSIRQREVWRKLLGTRLLWASTLVAISMLVLPFLKFASGQFALLASFGSLTLIGSAVFVTANLIFQKRFRYDLSVVATTISTVIYLGLILYLAKVSSPLIFLMFAQIINWTLMAFFSMAFLKRFLSEITPLFDKEFVFKLVKSSWPIAATLILNVLYFRADSFMIAYFKSVSDVGIYNVAYQVFQSVLVLPTFIMNAYYPIMLQSMNGIKLAALLLLGLASFASMITLLLAPTIMQLLTGGGFSGSAQALQILSLGFPAFFLSALLMWFLVTKGRYKTLLIIYCLGLLVNLILNFIYIPIYSFYAAAATTVISEYLILLMQLVSLRIVK